MDDKERDEMIIETNQAISRIAGWITFGGIVLIFVIIISCVNACSALAYY